LVEYNKIKDSQNTQIKNFTEYNKIKVSQNTQIKNFTEYNKIKVSQNTTKHRIFTKQNIHMTDELNVLK